MAVRKVARRDCQKRLKICSPRSMRFHSMLPLTSSTAGIRSELEAAGRPIGGNDLLIGAHALAIGAIIVTANVAEFKRVRSLKVELAL